MLLQTLNSYRYPCEIMLLPAEIESKTLIPALRAILAKKLAFQTFLHELIFL